MKEVKVLPEGMGRLPINLGKAGESNHLTVRFMTAEWKEAYPDAQIALYVTPPAGEPYMARTDLLPGGDTEWTVTAADTAAAGIGQVELVLRDAATDTTIKSATGATMIRTSPSQNAPGEIPPAYVPWFVRALELIQTGMNPKITVTEIEGGHQLDITDANGTESFNVMDGVDGHRGTSILALTSTVVAKVNSSSGTYYAVNKNDAMNEADVKEILIGDFIFKASNLYRVYEISNPNIFCHLVENLRGADGRNGVDGRDGIDGLSVTITNITESDEDGGYNIVEFNRGEPLMVKNGRTGAAGRDGKDGYTPVKGVDYFDGKDGAPGSAGRDGTAVTITNVTESNTDGGSNVITFSDGKKLVVKNGKTGASGKDGYTPVKGVDYFDGEDGAPGADGKNYVLTEADKKEIAGMIEVPEGEGGSGLPTGEAPYQQLVTDADGNAVWEDKLFGEQNGVILAETEISGEGENMVTLSMPIVVGESYTVVINGTTYECVAAPFSMDGVSAEALGDVNFLLTGEPTPDAPAFILLQIPGMTAAMMLDGSTSMVSVSGKSFKKLDPKYIDLAWMAEEKAVGETIVPLAVHHSGSNYESLDKSLSQVLTGGKKLVVFHDDQLYETTLVSAGEFIIGGNASLINDTLANTGEPFYFMINSEVIHLVFVTSDSCLYAIYEPGDVQKIPVRLPERYAPNNSILYVEATQSASANDVYTPTKTYEEILIAYARGSQVIFRYAGKLYYLSSNITKNGNAVFTAFDGDTMTVSSDSVATHTKSAVTYASEVEW